MSTPNKTAPDFGEPWQLTTDFAFDITIRGELAASFDKIEHATRAIACVNACAGMSDPAAEIQAMRDAVKEAREALERLADCDLDFYEVRLAESALSKLQPLLKP